MSKKNKPLALLRGAALWLSENIVFKNIILAISLIVILLFVLFTSLNVFTRHGERYSVPDFSDMTFSQAKESAKEFELQLEVIDSIYVTAKAKGVVLEQYPQPGSYVKKGRHIFLTTNTFTPKMLPMPHVVGYSLRQAKNKLVGSGFAIDKISYRNDLATNNVLQQIYNGKTISGTSNIMAEVGSKVGLIVGLNPVDPEPLIPNLIGMSIKEAKNILWENGFNVGEIEMLEGVNETNVEIAKVSAQNPWGLKTAMYGRTITLTASLDNAIVKKAVDDVKKEIARQKELEAQEETDSIELL